MHVARVCQPHPQTCVRIDKKAYRTFVRKIVLTTKSRASSTPPLICVYFQSAIRSKQHQHVRTFTRSVPPHPLFAYIRTLI